MTERDVLDVRSPQQWEEWLERNHDVVTEVWPRLFNKAAGDVPVSYGEAVEIALCFGWIDSLARGHDEVSRIQRFSPRKPGERMVQVECRTGATSSRGGPDANRGPDPRRRRQGRRAMADEVEPTQELTMELREEGRQTMSNTVELDAWLGLCGDVLLVSRRRVGRLGHVCEVRHGPDVRARRRDGDRIRRARHEGRYY